MKERRCPKCNEDDLIAITYAYHRIMDDGGPMGPQFDHFDWSESYALQCNVCGWTHGDPSKPLSDEPLERALSPELIELEEFERELREQAKAREGARSLCPGAECPEHDGTCA